MAARRATIAPEERAMQDVLPWLEYRWSFDYPVGMYPAFCARLRGTPARLEESLRGADPDALAQAPPGKWSAFDHAVHLRRVDQLWQVRIREYLAGAATLTPAGQGSPATAASTPHVCSLPDVLAGFRAERAATMAMLDPLSVDDAARTAHHPRLDRPMRLVDLCLFAAEHDDHHLAVIHSLLANVG
jgi:uncharacterized damage-inducible protein DinB